MDKFQNEYRKVQGIVGDKSFSVVLPKQFAINIGVHKGDFVKVHQVQNQIVIEKADADDSLVASEVES